MFMLRLEYEASRLCNGANYAMILQSYWGIITMNDIIRPVLKSSSTSKRLYWVLPLENYRVFWSSIMYDKLMLKNSEGSKSDDNCLGEKKNLKEWRQVSFFFLCACAFDYFHGIHSYWKFISLQMSVNNI